MFQTLGDTWPTLFNSALPMLTFALPTIWLVQQAGFYLEQIGYLSIVTGGLQCLVSLCLLKRQCAVCFHFNTMLD